MAKYNPTDLTSTYGAVEAINANFEALATLLEQCVFRDGTAPNAMNANLDMNHFEITNVAAPTNANSAARLSDLTAYIGESDLSLQSLLAGPAGSSMIGHTNSGGNPTTVQTRLRDFGFFITDLGAVGDGVTDNNTIINNMVQMASNLGESLQTRVRLRFPDGIYMLDCILVKPWVWFDFGNAIIRRQANADGSPEKSSMVRALPTLTGTTYYGTYKEIKISGGRFESNGFTVTNHIFNLIYCEDLELENITAVHSTAETWAFALGGRRIRGTGFKVLGGTKVFQDGVHIVHGQDIVLSDIYSESGDDAVAIGGEPSDLYLGADPDPIRNVTINGVVVKSERGHAVSVYVQSGATGPNWEISNIDINGVVGSAGKARNGGIWVTDKNNPTYGTSQIKGVRINGILLDVGSATHDDTNPYGIDINSVYDVKLEGSIQMTEGTGAVTGFRLGTVTRSQKVDLQINTRALKKRGGFSLVSSKRVTLRHSEIIGSSDQGTTGHIVLTDSIETRLIDNDLVDCKSGLNVISTNGGTLSSVKMRGNTLSHAAGATAGSGLALSSASSMTKLTMQGNDFTGCFAPTSSNVAFITTLDAHGNPGFSTWVAGTAQITAANTRTTVAHGADLATSSLSQILITPQSAWGTSNEFWIEAVTATGFDIVVDAAPGANFNFRYQVDVGKNPLV